MKIFFLLLALGIGLLGLAWWLTGESATAQLAGTSAIQDEVSYSNDIQPVVKDFCTTCHAGEDPEGDLVLTSYAEVRRHVEEGELLTRINDPKDPMPEDGLMPKPFRRLFQTWADGGYLDKGFRKVSPARTNYEEFTPPTITPIDVTQRGFEFLERMNGHWVGSMNLMGTDYDWMAFDYRPVPRARNLRRRHHREPVHRVLRHRLLGHAHDHGPQRGTPQRDLPDELLHARRDP